MIQPIVEGHGEVEALPVLLRRLQNEAGAHTLRIGRPIRHPRSNLVKRDKLQTVVQVARRQAGCQSILIVFDGDDDCPKTLGPQVQDWAQAAAGDVPCRVVMAHREYETWFLAAIESLRGVRWIHEHASPQTDPEDIRDGKGRLEQLMDEGFSYHAPSDQPKLSARLDLAAAHRSSRSFRRLTSAFGELLTTEGFLMPSWPPETW